MKVNHNTLTRALRDAQRETYDTLKTLYSPSVLYLVLDTLQTRLYNAITAQTAELLAESILQVKLALKQLGCNPSIIPDLIPSSQPIGFYL